MKTSVSGTTLTVTKKDNDAGGVLVTLQISPLKCSDDDVYLFEIGNSTYTTNFHVESKLHNYFAATGFSDLKQLLSAFMHGIHGQCFYFNVNDFTTFLHLTYILSTS